jgi:hypothetical protein
MVLLAALGAGLGLAVLIAQMHPTFTTRDLLQKVTGIRVLGAVTASVRSSLVVPWHRRQSVLVGGAMSLLLMVYLLNLLLSDTMRSVIRNVVG